MSYFIRSGNIFRVASEEAMDLTKILPVGNYTVKFNQMAEQFFLEMVDSFQQVPRLYGDTTKNADRILRTFMDRPNSTGVMLNGEKGSGKTLLAKTLSIEAAKMGIPTIIINAPWTGDIFNKFLQDIEQPCVILFDEFEKVYDNEDQEKALTLLDGVFPSRKLFVITVNNKWRVNEHMRNRPGRIYYMLDFTGLAVEFIIEYCNENLKNKEHIDKICQVATLFEEFNFDMLKALVEEMNRYDETPQEALRMLNVKPEFNNNGDFTVELFSKGRLIEKEELETTTWHGNPLTQYIHAEFDTDPKGLVTDGETWFTATFNPGNLKKVDAKSGKFAFENDEGDRLILTRKKEPSYRYLDF